MVDKHKSTPEYDGPPDHIPDANLLLADLAKRVAAGRKYTPHPTHDYDTQTGELTPRVIKKSPEKKSFFGNKKED